MPRVLYITGGSLAGAWAGGELADRAVADKLGPTLDRLRQAVGAEGPVTAGRAGGAVAGAAVGLAVDTGAWWIALAGVLLGYMTYRVTGGPRFGSLP